MQNPNDDRQALAGRTNCSTCNIPMVRLGTNYICPTQVGPDQGACPNSPINADQLLRMVATRILETVMTDPVVDRVTDLIQEEAGETSSRLQTHLDQTELALEKLNQWEYDLASEKDLSEEDTYHNTREIDDKRTALAFDARNSRKEIDAQDFISDRDIIRSNALDVATYLDEALPEHTNEFINNFVHSAGVGPNSIHLTYRFPIPTEQHPEGTTTDLIPRPD